MILKIHCFGISNNKDHSRYGVVTEDIEYMLFSTNKVLCKTAINYLAVIRALKSVIEEVEEGRLAEYPEVELCITSDRIGWHFIGRRGFNIPIKVEDELLLPYYNRTIELIKKIGKVKFTLVEKNKNLAAIVLVITRGVISSKWVNTVRNV
jgi:hypothetical protein